MAIVSVLTRVFALVAALQLLGGHWVVLQTAAWVGMTVEFSKEESISTALSKTFDGQHPCKICTAVKKGQSEEQRQATIKIGFKTEAVLANVIAAPVPSFNLVEFTNIQLGYPSRPQSPPMQPPLA